MHVQKHFILFSVGLLLFTACKKENSSSSNQDNGCVTQQALNNGDFIEGQYIVAYQSSATNRLSSESRLYELNSSVLQRNSISTDVVQQSFIGAMRGFVAKLTEQEAQRLKQDNSIATIEQDRVIGLSTCFTVVEPRLITWNIAQVGYGDGTGKTAWIIDSGIDFTHPDLNVDATRSRSFISGQTSAADDNGHGTHVAGIIGAKNNTIGVLGVASGATLIALKVLDKDGKGVLSDVIRALSYVSSNAKAGDVVNMSFGEEEPSNILDQQVQAIAAQGILFAIAAGNESKPASQFSPGRVNAPNVFTVSAVDSLGNFASFSNYGNDAVDVAAPGVRILSTYMQGKYARASGTSMAAPHVAGLLLLNGRNIKSSGVAGNDPDGTPDPIAHK
ncbi:MAG: S8 family serine peptidase [Flavisolibacter sp.]|nr:S8 family serine peptidase [Flavisolibacter sp.]